MKKKKTKLFSWTVASVAALTLLCGTWASAAVSLTSGADGIYLRNSGQEYTFQVDVPKNHFVAIRVDGVYLMGEKAPVQIDIEVGGTCCYSGSGNTGAFVYQDPDNGRTGSNHLCTAYTQ